MTDKSDTALIRCDACPVLCRIRDGQTGACDRYGNTDGNLIRVDPLVVMQKTGKKVELADQGQGWGGNVVTEESHFVTGVGSGTTYPDYKPAPFIIGSNVAGVDTVTVVSEGVFSYCGVKVKIDTDRYIGPETAPVFANGEQVGHVTTAEYGSQMLSLGGVRHLTGGSKKEGRITCDTLLNLCNKNAVTLDVKGGAQVIVQAGMPPIIDGDKEERMRVGCGSATIGIFAPQWHGKVDEVIVVDDHITGVLTEHQAGQFLEMPHSGIRVRGRKSTPGRYFQVADHGSGWGGTDIIEPLDIISKIDAKKAYPGMTLLMVSTTGQDSGWFVLNENLVPEPSPMPDNIQEIVNRIAENCEPALCTVLFMAGAGGSLRAGVTENPVRLTRSVKEKLTKVTSGGAPTYIWPGGGITMIVDVMDMPENSFGYVPTPALVAPIEFALTLADFEALGGHMKSIIPLESVLANRDVTWLEEKG
ncbi:MAG: hypothetical protein V7740_00875 [Pseudomonas marincola]